MLGNRKGYVMTTNTKSRNARRKKTGNESRRERGTHRERDEYGEYKLSRKEQKKIKKAKRKRKLIAMLAVEFVLILVLGVCVFGLSKIGKLQNLGVDPDEVGQNEDKIGRAHV